MVRGSVLDGYVSGGRLNDRGQTELPAIEKNESQDLVLPGFFGELSPRGYTARDELTFEEWKSDGHKLHVVSEASRWAVGDWWAFGGQRYGERAKTAASGIMGLAFQTLMNVGAVARKFETSRRREVLPFSFYAEVAGLEDEKADALLDKAEAEKWTQKRLRKEVKALGGRSLSDGEDDAIPDSRLIQQSLSNEHYTPSIYIEAAHEVMDGIDLDPASCAEANEVVRAKRFFSQEEDGLSREWVGRVWLNPPYGRLAGNFIAKLMQEIEAGRVTEVVVLVNAHCTDAAWFQPLWDGVLCFTHHRINFYGDDERSGSTHGSVFAYFGPNGDAFARCFGEFGAVVARVAL